MRRTPVAPGLCWFAWVALAACGSDGPDGPAGSAGDVAGGGGADGPDAADTDEDAAEGSGADAAEDAAEGSGADAAEDAAEGSGADAADDATDDAGAPPFTRTVEAAGAWPAPAGTRWVRSIIHLHSMHSHDACDGDPRPGGAYNLPCLASLRDALCRTKVDFAYLTDHPTHMVEVPFTDLLLHDPEADTLVLDDQGRPFANRFTCPDGFAVTTRAGAEDRLMPLGMHEHVAAEVADRDARMNAFDAETVGILRGVGALVWVAHTEEKSVDDLRALGVDGIEVYQLHANIDPDIRRDALGLDPFAPVTALFPFLTGTATTPPDLAVLAFLEPNGPSLRAWAQLLLERPVVGTGGTDAHENVFSNLATDGERLDSYRRMISWFSNYILADTVDGAAPTPEAVQAALGAGRVVIGFDVLGAIAGFDAWVRSGDARFEVGATVPWREGMSVVVDVPALVGPTGISAEVSCALLSATEEGWQVRASFGVGRSEHALAEPAVVRVECFVTGGHLRPYLTGFGGAADRSYPWIYANAFRVVAPG